MKTPYFLTLAVALLLIGCSNSKSRFWSSTGKNPVVVESMAAGDSLLSLHQQSLLPGDSKAMHGEINSEPDPYPLPNAVTYPFLRTFHVSYTGEAFTNSYTLARMTKDSPWLLQRAWRNDTQGHTVEEWPVR